MRALVIVSQLCKVKFLTTSLLHFTLPIKILLHHYSYMMQRVIVGSAFFHTSRSHDIPKMSKWSSHIIHRVSIRSESIDKILDSCQNPKSQTISHGASMFDTTRANSSVAYVRSFDPPEELMDFLFQRIYLNPYIQCSTQMAMFKQILN